MEKLSRLEKTLIFPSFLTYWPETKQLICNIKLCRTDAPFIVIVVKVECEDEKWIPKELFPLFSDVITIISGWANQKNNGENLLSYAERPSLGRVAGQFCNGSEILTTCTRQFSGISSRRGHP